MHVLILHDTLPPDASPDASDVLEQAAVIEAALRRRGDTTERLACSSDAEPLRRRLALNAPDLVFNLVESLDGRGSLISLVPAIVERFGVPMTGCPAHAIHVTSGKVLAKERLAAANLPTPAWRTEDDLVQGRTFDRAIERVIIKSVWEHASIGLDAGSVLRREGTADAAALASTLETRRDALGGEAFVEAFVPGREFNLSLLELPDHNEPQVLPPAEIEFVDWPADQPKIVGYSAKWDPQARAYHDTPRRFEFAARDAALVEALSSLARSCWRALGLRGYARVDFRVDERDRPWILEVNTNPCLSPDAGFAAALSTAGIDFDDAIDRLILAAKRPSGGA